PSSSHAHRPREQLLMRTRPIRAQRHHVRRSAHVHQLPRPIPRQQHRRAPVHTPHQHRRPLRQPKPPPRLRRYPPPAFIRPPHPRAPPLPSPPLHLPRPRPRPSVLVRLHRGPRPPLRVHRPPRRSHVRQPDAVHTLRRRPQLLHRLLQCLQNRPRLHLHPRP